MMLKILFRISVLTLFLAPSAVFGQSCDLSDLTCAQEGNKCNIHFKNLTGLIENTCKKTDSATLAMTVSVTARDDNDKTLGNKVSITAGRRNTMNLSKDAKANVSSIKAGGHGNFSGGRLSCSNIRTVLNGSGKCKIYLHREGYIDIAPFGYVYFDCSGGEVCTGY